MAKHGIFFRHRMATGPWLIAVAFLVLAANSAPAPAHETDQYTTPIGRTFADLGPYFSRWVYGAIERGCEKLNARIRADMKTTGASEGKARDYEPQTVADAVNTSFDWAMDVIEGLESKVKSTRTWREYPGRVVGYKRMFGNYLQHIHLPIDPRQFFRLWLASTMKVYGHYIGTDKIGHFTDMGKNYFNDYQAALRRGESETQALNAALDVGRKGLLFSETGMLGYLSAGAYSNGDMIANYTGMLFYQNLTKAVKLNGQRRPALLVRDGPFWKPAPHVRPDSDFMRWFFSDHWDEALNPSHYEPDMRNAVRKAVRDRSTGILERYRDVNGCRRPREWFERKTQSLTTYFGADYAQRGSMEDRITISRICYADLPADAPEDQRDHLGFNRLHQAAMNGQVEEVKKRLAAGWAVDRPIRSDEPFSSDWGNTALHLAVRGGHMAVAEALLAGKASVNTANDAGATPLHYATRDAAMVTLLLKHGAKIDAADVRGRTPLHWAVAYHADEVVAVLLEHGAPVNATDHDGRTPLHRAARFGDAAAIGQLVHHGGQVNAADRLGRTPLHLAAEAGQIEAVTELIRLGASVQASDRFGRRPLHEAATVGSVKVVKALIDAGASVEAADRQGTTPLHLAARHGKVGAVRQLLERGARVDAVNVFGATPLHEAAASGCRWTTAALLKAGGDRNAKDRRGRTPANVAQAVKHRDVVKLIKQKVGG